MELLSLLHNIRSVNIEALAEFAANNPDAHVEAALRTDDGELALDGPWSLPVRVDMILAEDGEITDSITVTPDKKISFEVFETLIGGLPVRLSPFGWDYTHINIAFRNPPASLEALSAWFKHWFDMEDESEADENQLYNVLHFMSDPEYTVSGMKLVVDFGSAPAEAFPELFSVLAKLGATSAEVN